MKSIYLQLGNWKTVMKTKENLLKWYNEKYCLQVVKQTGLSLQFVKNPTEEI